MRSRSDCYHLGTVRARELTSAMAVDDRTSFIAARFRSMLVSNTSHRRLGGRCAHEVDGWSKLMRRTKSIIYLVLLDKKTRSR